MKDPLSGEILISEKQKKKMTSYKMDPMLFEAQQYGIKSPSSFKTYS